MKDKIFHKGLNLLIIGGLLLFSIIRLFWLSNPVSIANKMSSDYPTGAVRYIQSHQLKGQMLSEYNWGGYLTWSLREYPVFLDGRTDLFSDEVIEEWWDIVMAYPGWEEKLKTRDIRLVLLTKEKPLNSILNHTGWDLVYQDQISQLYIQPPTQKSLADN